MASGKVGRPSMSWTWAPSVREILRAEPDLKTAEVYRRARLQGYPGGKSSFYQLVALCRLGPAEPKAPDGHGVAETPRGGSVPAGHVPDPGLPSE